MKGSTPRQAAGCLFSRHREGTGYFQDHGAQVRRLPGNAGQPDSQAVYPITNLPKFRRRFSLNTNPDVFCQSFPVVTRGWLFGRCVVAYGSSSQLLNGAIRSCSPVQKMYFCPFQYCARPSSSGFLRGRITSRTSFEDSTDP